MWSLIWYIEYTVPKWMFEERITSDYSIWFRISLVSYSSIRKYILRRCELQTELTFMSRNGHMAAKVEFKIIKSVQLLNVGRQYLDLTIIFMFYHLLYFRLCWSKIINSFCQLMRGYSRAQSAMGDSSPEVLRDYYGGDIFRNPTWTNYVIGRKGQNFSYFSHRRQMVSRCLSQVRLTEHVGLLCLMYSTLIFHTNTGHVMNSFHSSYL